MPSSLRNTGRARGHVRVWSVVMLLILPCPTVLSSSKPCLHVHIFLLLSVMQLPLVVLFYQLSKWCFHIYSIHISSNSNKPSTFRVASTCQLCETWYNCSRSVLMFVLTHPVSCVTDIWCSLCLVFVTPRVFVCMYRCMKYHATAGKGYYRLCVFKPVVASQEF